MVDTVIELGEEVVKASEVSLPESKDFRASWVLSDGAIGIDIVKARELWRDKIRAARVKAFDPLDNLYRELTEKLIPAQASGEDVSSLVAEIQIVADQKQALRDATADPAIDEAQTIEELKQVLPAGLSID